MALWNVRDLPAPPVNSAKYSFESIDFDRLRKTFAEASSYFLSCNYLYTEAVLLSTFAYRMKLKFRMNKDFKQLEKINKALRVYFKMNVYKILKDFYQFRIGDEEKIVYLPTRDMLDYVLVKIQGLGKLLVRIVETCKIAAEYMQLKLQIGHFWQQNLLVFCMVSRIYVITRHIVKFTCSMYDKILPFRNKLINVNNKISFLPENYDLPKDLRHWLNVDWIDEDIQYIEIDEEEPINIPFFNLADSDDEVEFCDEYIDIDNERTTFSSLLKRVKKDLNTSSLRGFSEDDIGEIIDLVEPEIIINSESSEDALEDRSLSPTVLTFNVSESDIEVQKLNKNKGKSIKGSSVLSEIDIGEEIPSTAQPSTSKKQNKNKLKSMKNDLNSTSYVNKTGDIIVIPDTPFISKKKNDLTPNVNKKGVIIVTPDNKGSSKKKHRKRPKNKNKLLKEANQTSIKSNVNPYLDIEKELASEDRLQNKETPNKEKSPMTAQPSTSKKQNEYVVKTMKNDLNSTPNVNRKGDIIVTPNTPGTGKKRKRHRKKKHQKIEENILKEANQTSVESNLIPNLDIEKEMAILHNQHKKRKRKFEDRLKNKETPNKRPRRACVIERMNIDNNLPSTSTNNNNLNKEPIVKMDTTPLSAGIIKRKRTRAEKEDLKNRLRIRRKKLKKLGLCKCYIIKRSILGSGRIQVCKYCKEHPLT